ncbi:acetyl-CoA synthetase-like protein [Phlebopus sp. FC_14]|nr:acetyl-CoA synthetase-like protein [Phlebopus sp. FC_14]
MPSSFLLTPPESVHATSPTCSFAVPKLDGSLTLPESYNWHYDNNPDHPVFTYVDQFGHLTTLTYADVVPASHRAGRHVMNTCNISVNADRPVVAIVAATTSTIVYATVLIGMLLAAVPVFPISPRNSPAAVAHLLREARVSSILVSDDQPSRDLTIKALELLTGKIPKIHAMPCFRQLYIGNRTFERLPAQIRDFNDLTMIVHSSGSTSFPKLIRWNHKTLLHLGLMPHFGQHDLCERVLACHALVMFHGLGVALIAWLPSTGLVMAVCDPELPLPQLTPDSIFSEITASPVKPDYVLAVPSFLQAWSEDDKKVSYFSGMKGGLIYGGGPLAKSAGDHLVEHGVPVYTAYGASEVGAVSTFLPECQGMDWEHFSINKNCAAEFAPDGTGTFEFVVVGKPTQELLFTNCTYGGLPAYMTNDVLAPHPSKPGFWRVVGRADDQIMLLTGEKTNPGPLEAILNEHPHVAASVMFGRGRMQNGVLVLLNEQHLSNVVDNSRTNEYRDSLWPNIEKMNSFAPTHSKIFKEMIIFARADKPFAFTAKRTLKRHQILADYESEINDLYRVVEENCQQDVDAPTSWSIESSTEFVRTVFQRVLGSGVGDDQNILELGCDSLNATWIRNSILRGLRLFSKRISRDIELTFVYQYPTIASLSKFILRITQFPVDNLHMIVDPVDQMQSLVSRFTTDFPVRMASEPALPTGDIVLVTGTTGSLGCAALVHLIECDSVEKIYALNRSSSGKSLHQRQQQALEERGYSPSLIHCPKVVLLEGDTSRPGLALEDAVFKQLCSSITHIIHIAWPVDFDLTLTSFEPAIVGLRNLVDLALSSPNQAPSQFVFASSIGVLSNWQSEPLVREEFVTDAAVAAGQGYTESKWVSEGILGVASERTALRPVVVRIGQLCGTPSGAWNASDWFPLLIKSGIALAALPDLRGVCNWLPVDVAAKALCDFRRAVHCTLHLVHPRPVQIESIMQTLSTELHLPVMPFSEWMVRLEKSASGGQGGITDLGLQDIPALKILPFLREVRSKLDRYHEDIQEGRRDNMGFPILDMDKALCSSPGLRDTETSIADANVLSWVQYWRRIGFLRG